jgi:hypothetical protein
LKPRLSRPSFIWKHRSVAISLYVGSTQSVGVPGSGVIASDLMIILYSKPEKLTYLACVINIWIAFI